METGSLGGCWQKSQRSGKCLIVDRRNRCRRRNTAATEQHQNLLIKMEKVISDDLQISGLGELDRTGVGNVGPAGCTRGMKSFGLALIRH